MLFHQLAEGGGVVVREGLPLHVFVADYVGGFAFSQERGGGAFVSASSIRLSMTAIRRITCPARNESEARLALPTGLARKSASALLAALRENRVLGLLGDAELEHAFRRD